MKNIIAISLLLVIATSTMTNEENVLQLLFELKHNAELELEGLDLAWQRRIADKQNVADSINQQVINQRAECQNKQDDVTQKQSDILTSEQFIAWMTNRQSANSQRISVLEANVCALTNNYVNDIRNYRYALALIKFLREELATLQQGGASLAQVGQFNERLSKFVNLFKRGELIQLIDNEDNHVIIPEIEQGQFDEVSLIQILRPKALIQLDQAENTDTGADNAVVLIPGCDNQVGTVVVVQNDDGTNTNEDVNVKITNGGTTSVQSQQQQPKHHKKQNNNSTNQSNEDTNNTQSSNQDQTSDSAQNNSNNGSEENTQQNQDDQSNPSDQQNQDDSSDSTDPSDQSTQSSEQPTNNDSNDNQIEINDISGGQTQNDTTNKDVQVPSQAKSNQDGTEPTANGTNDEDYPDTWEGFAKLLDAIEAKSKGALEKDANNQVNSSAAFADFKLRIEAENNQFDKSIQYEKQYLVKQVNQLSLRRQATVLCNARLKQIQVAYQVSLKDVDAAKQFYQEQRELKQEEVNTFDDVFRIYTTQVNH